MNAPRVIDAHVHFWNPELLSYPWLRELPSLRRAFLPRDLGAFTRRDVDKVLFVEANCEAAQAEAELDFVDGLAADEPRIAGSIAFVNLNDEPARADMLRRLASRERVPVVGVRQNVQGQPNGFCITPAFVAGVEQLAAHGLTFDLCITADQLGDAAELVRRCPATRFVLDHCGKPAIRDNAFVSWATGIGALGSLPNVACKISGLFTEARAEQRSAGALRPYVDHVRECFGPTRLLYGSDWPVVTLAGGEAHWRETMHELTKDWSAADRQLFYTDNVMRHYPRLCHAVH
jgi:L-fuconolactonase